MEVNLKNKFKSRVISAGRSVAPLITCSLLCATAVYAQDPFISSAAGASATAVNVVKLLGIGLIGAGGVTLWHDSDHGVGKKVISMGLGALFMYGSRAIGTYVQQWAP